MTDTELLDRVRQLRDEGRSPKDIARSLGLRPAAVAPLVRQLAAGRAADAPVPGEPALVGCWVNQGWSQELGVSGHPEWPRGTASNDCAGLATVFVAREARGGSRVSACSILVDTYCLGVKNAVPPRKIGYEALDRFRRDVYGGYRLPPVEAPLGLAQHLVLGAVEYARGLGFRPHRDLAPCLGHLGSWSGPSAITFGRRGEPMYVAGPYDDTSEVLRTLERSVGRGKFNFLVAQPV